jgi:hypothetical protein
VSLSLNADRDTPFRYEIGPYMAAWQYEGKPFFESEVAGERYFLRFEGIYLTISSHIETIYYKILMKNINKIMKIDDNTYKLIKIIAKS